MGGEVGETGRWSGAVGRGVPLGGPRWGGLPRAGGPGGWGGAAGRTVGVVSGAGCGGRMGRVVSWVALVVALGGWRCWAGRGPGRPGSSRPRAGDVAWVQEADP